jgi:hypothetical protein
LTAELKQKVTEDRTIKQKKARNFRGLQPQERPIILPGGRKWKNPKDAMNDEMIAEIISSQAELIMGTTLGYVLITKKLPFSCKIHFIHLNFSSPSSSSSSPSNHNQHPYESPILNFDER